MNREESKIVNPDVCIRCATCMGICPVARVTASFPGPKQAGPGAERFRKPGDPSVDEWIHLCIGCRLCDTVCSSCVNVSEMNLLAKAKYRDEHGMPLRDWMFAHNSFVEKLAGRVPRLSNAVLRNPLVRRLLDRLLKIDLRRPLPVYETTTFRQWFRTHTGRGGKPIGYFYGCYANTHERDVAIAAVQVLEAAGYEVVIPRQECCGLPALGQGDVGEARRMAERNVPSLLAAVRSGLEIVFTSTSCGHMLKYEYSRFLEIPDADEVARHLHELFDYLRDLQGKGQFDVRFRSRPLRAAYFAPCHLRSLQIGFPSLDILRRIPELQIEMVDADCCGMGGLYGFKKEKAPIADAIGADLTKAVERLNVEMVLTECEGCRMQIQRLTGLRALHPIQIVRDALEPGAGN